MNLNIHFFFDYYEKTKRVDEIKSYVMPRSYEDYLNDIKNENRANYFLVSENLKVYREEWPTYENGLYIYYSCEDEQNLIKFRKKLLIENL